MAHFTHMSRLGRTLVLLALTAAFASPAAATAGGRQDATSGDALSRYVTNRPTTGDAVNRYLFTKQQTTKESAPQPVSDVMNSLQVAGSPDTVDRYLSTTQQAYAPASQPISDVMSSLEVVRRVRVAGETPISDTANSLIVGRAMRNAAKASPSSSSAVASAYNSFDWSDATIGAAATFGLVVLAAAAALVTIRRRPVREQTHI